MKLMLLSSMLLMATACAPGQQPEVTWELRSLTDGTSGAKKYYLGWGEYLTGFMGNETRYDVKHTHDVFTSGAGGNYSATTLSDRQFSGSDVKQSMNAIREKIRDQDMFVQYSSGHGFPQGLGVGVTYADIVANTLAMPGREKVVFLMACHSGGLVDQFNAKKSQWQDYAATGKTLFVMSSSTVAETSSTGPRRDADESDGPDGSAGSAYGHALWKSLTGEADGYLDGVRDGFISLGEIAAYATWKTRRVGGHTPQVTGSYHRGLIMNKVPKKSWVSSQKGGTQDMSESEVMDAVRASDAGIQAELEDAWASDEE